MENTQDISKTEIFRFIVNSLTSRVYSNIWINDKIISFIPVQKLLFFICVASTEISLKKFNNTDRSLFHIFDEFYSISHGNVEKDIHKVIFNSGNSCTKREFLKNIEINDTHIEEIILDSISLLEEKCPNIKQMDYKGLIEYNWKYKNWKYYYDKAIYEMTHLYKNELPFLLNMRIIPNPSVCGTKITNHK